MYQGLGVSGSLSQLKQDQEAGKRAVDKVRRKQQARALRVLHSPRPTGEFHPVCPDTQETADLAGDIYREYGAAMDDALGKKGFLPGVPAWIKWGALLGIVYWTYPKSG